MLMAKSTSKKLSTYSTLFSENTTTTIVFAKITVANLFSVLTHHPTGTHDGVFWATALAVYATANMEPEPTLTVIPR
jgi:hypothetical protein